VIAKVIKVKSHGGGKALGRYIVNANLGRYVLGQEQTDHEKVLFAECHNCGGIETPGRAVEWMAHYNSLNTRSQQTSAHLIVSLQDGEKLSREQWRDVEQTMVVSLGMETHPRISAVHQNTENSHMHIWLSRLEPERHHAIHPHGENYRLQRAAQELEQRHELGITRHTTNWEQTHERRLEHAREREKLYAVARDISPSFATADDRWKDVRRQLGAANEKIADTERVLGNAQYHAEKRHAELSWWRRVAHNHGWHRDAALKTLEQGVDQLGKELRTLGERREGLSREMGDAAAVRRTEFAQVRPAAERELQRRDVERDQERALRARDRERDGFDMER